MWLCDATLHIDLRIPKYAKVVSVLFVHLHSILFTLKKIDVHSSILYCSKTFQLFDNSKFNAINAATFHCNCRSGGGDDGGGGGGDGDGVRVATRRRYVRRSVVVHRVIYLVKMAPFARHISTHEQSSNEALIRLENYAYIVFRGSKIRCLLRYTMAACAPRFCSNVIYMGLTYHCIN